LVFFPATDGERIDTWAKREGAATRSDAIRRLDEAHGLEPRFCHALCIQAMSMTAQVASRLLGGVSVIGRIEDFDLGSGVSGARILDVAEFLDSEKGDSETSLPHSWQVTSDSIAAHLAKYLRAQELVLLKSAAPPSSSADVLAGQGYVDDFFPIAGQGLAVRIVNLKNARGPELTISAT
jgi:hypothetical protein